MDAFVQTALCNALAATALAIVAAVVGYFCRRPALTHGLWLLVLLKLVTPPLFDVPVLTWLAPVTTADAILPGDSEVFELVALSPDDAADTEDEMGSDVASSTVPAATVEREPADRRADLAAIVSAINWKTVALASWFIGAVGWLLLAVARIGRFHQLLRHAAPAPDWLQARSDRLAERMGMDHAPGVWLVPGRISPMLWSFGGAPRLLLPVDLLDRVTAAQRDTLLVHELAHLRRRDNWLRSFELLVTTLYWWHPVVWWARREMHQAEEQCCDAWVVSLLPGSARSYATALVETVDFLSEARPVLPPAASGLGQVQDLRRRLTMIMRGKTPKGLTWRGVLGVCCLGVLILPLVPSWARTAADDNQAADKRIDEKKKADVANYEQEVAKLKAMLAEAEAKLKAARSKDSADTKDKVEKRAVFIVKPDGDKKQEVIELIIKDGVIQQKSGPPVKIIEAMPDGKPLTMEKKDFIIRAHDGRVINALVPADKKPAEVTVTATPDGKVYGYRLVTPEKLAVSEFKPQQLTVTSTVDGKIQGRLVNPADSDARMKALEKRLDELTREVENLRKELKKEGGGSEPIRSRIRLSEPAK